jgi:hypothetical protein
MEDAPRTSVVNESHYADTPMNVDGALTTTSGVQILSDMSDGDALTSHIPPSDDEEETQPPPAKRRRMHSDADQASLVHVSTLSCLVCSMQRRVC